MAKIRYLDFDLSIKRAEAGYRAEVVSRSAGQGSAEFESPFSELEIENLLLRMGRPRRGVRRVDSPEMGAVKVFGARLFEGQAMGGIARNGHFGLSRFNCRAPFSHIGTHVIIAGHQSSWDVIIASQCRGEDSLSRRFVVETNVVDKVRVNVAHNGWLTRSGVIP